MRNTALQPQAKDIQQIATTLDTLSQYPMLHLAFINALLMQFPLAKADTLHHFTKAIFHPNDITKWKGKVTYIDFWASWCTPCLTQLPSLEIMMKRFVNEEVAFLLINMDEDTIKWKHFLEEHPLQGIHLHYKNDALYHLNIAELLQIKHLPTGILIDQNGQILNNTNERLDLDTISRKIQNLIPH